MNQAISSQYSADSYFSTLTRTAPPASWAVCILNSTQSWDCFVDNRFQDLPPVENSACLPLNATTRSTSARTSNTRGSMRRTEANVLWRTVSPTPYSQRRMALDGAKPASAIEPVTVKSLPFAPATRSEEHTSE